MLRLVAVTRSLALAAATFVAVPAAAQDRPFLFSVATPTDTAASSFRLEYDVGAGERPLVYWSLSGIVLCEITRLAEIGRISIDLDDREVMRVLSLLKAWPIDLAVCRAIGQLDVDGDPADDLIAATSLAH